MDGLRRSPGFASKDDCIRVRRAAFPGFSQWPMAISSLTVARQRGICTRFPVFAERRKRAFRTTLQRAEKRCEEIYRLKGRKSIAFPHSLTADHLLHRPTT